MKVLNSKIMKEFLNKASQRLKGEWLLVGGTLLPALGLDIRATADIDFIGLSSLEQGQQLELMQIAEDLGLSIETVNQAALFFVEKAKISKGDKILLLQSKNNKIYRPTVEFYWKLKLARFSETDLLDCQHYYQWAQHFGDAIDRNKLLKLISEVLKQPCSKEKNLRMEKLRDFLRP
ncbi:MAG TPA: hypothetical protein PLJ21_04460 [Pseudobdellovibrionaceae bacterium]|nr:hypothetical protein [Pseudobdellovibrionaceae bacterium]